MSSKEPLNPNISVSPHSSSTPLITSSQRQDREQVKTLSSSRIDGKSQKPTKKILFGLGKKNNVGPMDSQSEAGNAPRAGAGNTTSLPAQQDQQQQSGVKRSSPPAPLSPSRLAYQPVVAASPSHIRSSSPRLHSPGNSEIFERNVQEHISISNLHGESPAHIPAHVITEDSIPPALEASAQAITSSTLDPDDVEIVTSSSHQPAASGIEGSACHTDTTSLHSPPLLHHNKPDDITSLLHSGSLTVLEDDSASNYGQLDPTDVRRLSFISFKDIVQSEQHQMTATTLGEPGSRDSLHIQDRAGSPFRLPRSPTSTTTHSIDGLTTPPTGVSTNPIVSAAEQSPTRSIRLGSPGSQHGDLNIETMRQVLRKTASGDLSGARSAGMSPVSDAASFRDVSHGRTNT